MNKGFIQCLKTCLPAERLLLHEADRLAYGYDNSRLQDLPDAVALPVSADEISQIIHCCRKHQVAIIPRGRGTGTTGATVPIDGGLVISMERMNRILELDPANRVIRAEAGVNNQTIQDAAASAGFFWPPDPTSAAYCSIGGNLAYNSAGPRAVKYGTCRENTLGLKLITGTGETLNCGVYTTKGVVGLDLTRLVIGSEGALGIITEATLKLVPLAQGKRTLKLIYSSMTAAASAVSRIMSQPVIPCALEFMDGNALDIVRAYSRADLPDNAGAMLMVEVDGSEACLDDAVASVAAAAKVDGHVQTQTATTPQEIRALWDTRKALSPSLRKIAPKKINEDVVVPVSHMAELINGLNALSQKYAIPIVNFGHAGNGNIHVNLLVDPDDPHQASVVDTCLDEVFDLVLKLRGTLSGEHGVGIAKRDYVARELGKTEIEIMKGIKRQFDPDNLLNPGKSLPL